MRGVPCIHRFELCSLASVVKTLLLPVVGGCAGVCLHCVERRLAEGDPSPPTLVLFSHKMARSKRVHLFIVALVSIFEGSNACELAARPAHHVLVPRMPTLLLPSVP